MLAENRDFERRSVIPQDDQMIKVRIMFLFGAVIAVFVAACLSLIFFRADPITLIVVFLACTMVELVALAVVCALLRLLHRRAALKQRAERGHREY
jgi:uncharacterized membrane protein YdfJ with MMPL/SSD domain